MYTRAKRSVCMHALRTHTRWALPESPHARRMSPSMQDSIAQLGAFVGATTARPPPPPEYPGYDPVFKSHYPKFYGVMGVRPDFVVCRRVLLLCLCDGKECLPVAHARFFLPALVLCYRERRPHLLFQFSNCFAGCLVDAEFNRSHKAGWGNYIFGERHTESDGIAVSRLHTRWRSCVLLWSNTSNDGERRMGH